MNRDTIIHRLKEALSDFLNDRYAEYVEDDETDELWDEIVTEALTRLLPEYSFKARQEREDEFANYAGAELFPVEDPSPLEEQIAPKPINWWTCPDCGTRYTNEPKNGCGRVGCSTYMRSQ